MSDTEIRTEGGAAVEGDVHVDKGDFVGRDKILNIDIRLLPLVLGLALLAIVLAYFLLRPDRPQVMDAEFNIAVAEFLVEDANGEQRSAQDGQNFSNWLYGRLNTVMSGVLEELFVGTYLVWPPQYTGVVRGETPEERENSARDLAEEIQADVVIYGVIVPLGDDQITMIEFYVRHDSFSEGLDVKGRHNLGNALPIGKPFDEALVSVQNQPLSARAQGLSLLAVGLAYYAVDDFEDAINYFLEADDTPGWLDLRSTGKHVVKMLVGNAYVRRASKEKSPAYLPTANDYYDQSLAIDDQYARAEVGRAGVLYLMALGDPYNADAPTQVDKNLLDRAEDAFERALTLENLPASANVGTKVQFGLAQIYLLRYTFADGDWLEQAVALFQAVVDQYEGGNAQIEDIAAHAYARLGLIRDRIDGDPVAARDLYMKAVDHASPFYKAEYQARVGDLYAATCELQLAAEAYTEARGYALQNADQDSFNRYSEKLNDLSALEECS